MLLVAIHLRDTPSSHLLSFSRSSPLLFICILELYSDTSVSLAFVLSSRGEENAEENRRLLVARHHRHPCTQRSHTRVEATCLIRIWHHSRRYCTICAYSNLITIEQMRRNCDTPAASNLHVRSRRARGCACATRDDHIAVLGVDAGGVLVDIAPAGERHAADRFFSITKKSAKHHLAKNARTQ